MNVIGHQAGTHCTFRVHARWGVWQVTREHVFYGDYLNRRDAVAAACLAAQALEAAGGTARVLCGVQQTVVAHQANAFPVSPGGLHA